jgi:hypothetical protein
MFSFTDGGRCAGRARFIANSAPYPWKLNTLLCQEQRANFLFIPAYENKRCRCLAVYLEPLPLKKYVEYDIFQGSEEDEMGVVDKQ